MVNVFLWGIGLNVLLLSIYYLLHTQIERFCAVRERTLLSVRRSRLAFYYVYLFVLIVIAIMIYLKSLFLWEFIFGSLAIIIILDIINDRSRLVLSQNALVSVSGFFNMQSVTVEYKDIVLVEVNAHVTGMFFGFGDVKISVGGSAGRELLFKDIPHYLKVKNLIEETKIAQERGLRRRVKYVRYKR